MHTQPSVQRKAVSGEYCMIKENQRVLNILNVISDFLILFLSYIIATYIRFFCMYIWYESKLPALWIPWNRQYLTAALLFALVEILFFYMANVYSHTRRERLRREITRITEMGALAVLVLMAFLYLTRIVDFSRIALAIYYVLSTVLLLIKRLILRHTLRYFRRKGYNQKHVILVGNGKHARQYVESIKANPDLGYTIDGYVSRVEKPGLGKHLGAYEDLEQILDQPGIDEVIITLEIHEAEFMKKVISACDKSGIRICIIPYFNDYIPAYPSIDTIGESRIINIREIPLDHMLNAFVKRFADIIGSLFLIILTSPVMLVAAIGVKLSSPGPVIFKQERIGLNKEHFYMYKFRSMRVNADSTKAWSTDEDPRKTRFGSLIRKFSIDELPQFFNVLKGDMSLVGPRPEIPYYVNQFKEEIPLYLVRQQVRPGITGWAQVHGYRGDTSIPERIRHDIWYIEHWSIWLDARIVFRTIFGGMINSEKVTK